jgi:hypothetical protein
MVGLDLVEGIEHHPFFLADHFVALEMRLGIGVRVVAQDFQLDQALLERRRHLWSPE